MSDQKAPSNTHPPSPIPNPQSPIPNLLALAAYFLLTVLMTWPTALHLTEAIPGDGFDGWQNYWNLWWVKKALLVLGTNPYFTPYLYPPTGTNLLFHTLNIFNSLWALPLQLNFGLAIAYNSIVFFSFVLAGYGGYLLSLYTLSRLKLPPTTGLRLAAFVGGLVFTMSPFHMAHLLGHMQVFSMIWPPFYVLWLLRTLQPWTPSPTYSRRNAVLTCLFLILATLVDWYHTLYLLIFTGLVLLWTLWRQGRASSGQGSRVAGGRGAGSRRAEGRRAEEQRSKGAEENVSRSSLFAPQSPVPAPRSSLFAPRSSLPVLRPLWLVLGIGLAFVLVFSPLLLPMIREARTRPELQVGLEQSITLSADLLAFFLPSEMHPLWGQWAKNIADDFSTTTSERLIFAGFVPLALGIFIVIRSWSRLIVKFWLSVVAFFFILALGPYLHVGGKVVSIGGWPIPMPYLLFYHTIPFIGLTRSLSRYDLMVMLSLGVLVAIALTQLQLSINDPLANTKTSHKQLEIQNLKLKFANWPPILVLLLICFEFWPVPYPISKLDVPQFYFDIGADPDDYTIAELPMNWDRPTPLLHQVTHGKRLLTAYTSRNSLFELAWRTPVLQHWRYLGPDIIDQPLAAIAPTIFFDFNLRYIVLDYWQMPPGPEREATERWVSAALPEARPVYDDGRLKVYQAPPKQETQPYLTLGHGWHNRQESGPDVVTRSFVATADNQPELFLHHPQKQSLRLAVTATALVPQNLTVFAGGEPVGQLAVTQTLSTQLVALPPLASDMVRLRFRSDNPASPVVVRRIGLRQGE